MSQQPYIILALQIKKNKNIRLGFVLISTNKREKVCKYRWGINNEEYAYNNIVKMTMHRYIMNCTLNDGRIIDHLYHNKLDNQDGNIRDADDSQNARNKKKQQNLTSQYYGVSQIKKNQKWKCAYRGKHFGHYENETDAAQVYNFVATFYDTQDPRLNFDGDLEISYQLRQKAEKFIQNQQEQKNKRGKYKVYDFNIQQNFILMYDNSPALCYLQNGKVTYCLVSLEDYEFLSQQKIYKGPRNYPQFYCDKNLQRVHLYVQQQITEKEKNKVSDHINRNIHDSRRQNLRQVDQSINCHNKTSKKEYFGAVQRGSSWYSIVRCNYETYQSNEYDNMLDAIRHHDLQAIQLYGEYANINNVQLDGYILKDNELIDIYQGTDWLEKNINPYHGVCYLHQKNQYQSYIRSTGQNKINLGTYNTCEEAAFARDLKLKEIYGNKLKDTKYILNNVFLEGYQLMDNLLIDTKGQRKMIGICDNKASNYYRVCIQDKKKTIFEAFYRNKQDAIISKNLYAKKNNLYLYIDKDVDTSRYKLEGKQVLLISQEKKYTGICQTKNQYFTVQIHHKKQRLFNTTYKQKQDALIAKNLFAKEHNLQKYIDPEIDISGYRLDGKNLIKLE